MTAVFMVLRVFTTRAAGNARWICSPRLSMLTGSRVGGMPREKSRGLATSISSLPARLSAPAAVSAARLAAPAEALTTTSAPCAASAKVLSRMPGCSVLHCGYGGVP